ncbi:hypothetical protein PG913_11130 [Tenacibaculum pacificus]|uniref:hypothetical protein n=1 Tax=Tenacibaculum pacificus TaxID=3018314 RepID=UPI0022F3F117|nr:hypothetical protein [Tenacibaculum pacificus]WBX73387.1 hypothetical protein PG913_11130 [Tenacibaculum pacificus]
MATINFIYRGSQPTGKLSIRLNHGKQIDFRLATSFQSKKEYWLYKTTKNGKTGIKHRKLKDLAKAGSSATLKNHKAELEKIQDEVLKYFLIDYNNGVAITSAWLKKCIDKNNIILDTKEKITVAVNTEKEQLEAEQRQKEFVANANLLATAIEGMFVKYETNKREQQKYKVTHKLLLKYQIAKETIFNTKDLSQSFSVNFKNWAYLEMQYTKSYINSQLKKLRSSVLYHYENDENDIVEISKTLSSFEMFKDVYKDKEIVVLTYDELDRIDNTILKDEVLQDAKKAILIGCETGLRYSDINKLNDSNSKNIKGINYWTFRTQKTNATVQIPISKRIKTLIDTYGLPNTNYPANGVKLNEDIKEVCRLAGINEKIKGSKAISLIIYGEKEVRNKIIEVPKYKLITTRTFRRSFATNYYGNIDTNLIMMVTAHKQENQLRAYIGSKGLQDIERSKTQVDEFHEKRKLEKENRKLTIVGKASNQ